jgi:hypothetical protein
MAAVPIRTAAGFLTRVGSAWAEWSGLCRLQADQVVWCGAAALGKPTPWLI